MPKYCECEIGVDFEYGRCKECGLPCGHWEAEDGFCLFCGQYIRDEQAEKEDDAFERWQDEQIEKGA